MPATNNAHTKPNVLVVTQLYPNVATSFQGEFVARQLQHLKARYNIVVLTTHYIPLYKRRTLRQPRYEFRDGIHVYSLPHVAYWLVGLRLLSRHFRNFVLADKLFTGRKIRNFAQKLHLRYRFSLVHGHETYVGDEAASIGRMLQIPSVFTLHGLYSHHLQSFGGAVLRRAVVNMNATDRLIAVSRVSAESYQAHGVHRDFEIIPNGIELPPSGAWHPNVPEGIMTFARGRFVLLTIGYFSP
jgi:glycosyltransferase involved in cell wall biosynthesis